MADFAVIGLGNPGEVYRNTRHNLGFWLLDKIAEKGNVKFKNSREYHADHTIMPYKESNILLIKPMTFMNESGRYLLSILNYFRNLNPASSQQIQSCPKPHVKHSSFPLPWTPTDQVLSGPQ